MKPRIVADGRSRLERSAEYRALRRQLRKSVREEHAAELAEEGFFRRLLVRWQMHREYRRRLRQITPSPYSLWLGHLTAAASASSKRQASPESDSKR